MSDLIPRINAAIHQIANHRLAIFRGTDEERARYRNELTNVVGCTSSEIADLEAQLGCQFPDVFRDFLLHFGRNSAGLFDGSSLEPIEMYVELRELARQLVAEIGEPSLIPPDAVVFLQHQGYDFAFFVPASDDSDPAVFWCDERGRKHRAANSITEFLMSYARVGSSGI